MSTVRRRPTPWAHFMRRFFPAYVIFHYCGMHYPVTSNTGVGVKSEIHLLLYMVLTAVTWEFVRTFQPRLRVFGTVKVAIALIAFAVFDEATQPIFGRSPELYDWFLDVAGIILAILILYRFRNSETSPTPIINRAASSSLKP